MRKTQSLVFKIQNLILFFNMYLYTVGESTRITQEMFFFVLMLLPLPLTLEWSAFKSLGSKILSFINNIVSGTR